MYYTSSGGCYYQGSVKRNRSAGRKLNSHARHLNISRIVKAMILLSLIGVSLMFGAMIQAYATNDQEAIIHPSSDRPESAYLVYSVASGDTLWSIAKAHRPENTDIRIYIAEMKDMNNLKTSKLQVGQVLQVPIIR